MTSRFLLAAFIAALAIAYSCSSHADTLAPGEHWFPTTLKHRDARLSVLVYQPPSGKPLFRVLDLDTLGIPYASDEYIRHRGENYVREDAFTLHEAHIDLVMQRVHFVRKVRPHWPADLGEQLLIDVRTNGVMSDTPVFATVTATDIHFDEETLKQLRIDVPEAYGPFLEDGMPVHALAGENFYIDFERLYLEMTVPPEQFEGTLLHIEPATNVSTVTNASPSVILGYHASGGQDALGGTWYSATGDLTVSAGRFLCRSQHLARSEDEEIFRLDTSCIADWPTVPLSAGLGDHFSMPGTMGETVSYGGAWIGTDYSLQPYRNLQPSLLVDGYARLPSTLEIWIDQQLGLREPVPPGPFIVDRLPALTGTGELQAVLVNAAGRQVVLSTPVYSDPRLLQPGVADWRIESGKLRPGIFAANGDEYGRQFVAATARVGMTRWLTGEVHAERSEELENYTVASALRLWRFGIVELGAGYSQFGDAGLRGESRLVGYSWRGNRLHVSFRDHRRESTYVSLGYPLPGEAPRRERIASVGMSFGFASIQLAGIERRYDDPLSDHQLATAALTIPVGPGQLRLTARQNLDIETSEPVYAAYFSMPLGTRRHAFASVDDLRADDPASTIGYTHSPPIGGGGGYRLQRYAMGDSERYYAEATWRGRAGTAAILATHANGETLPAARIGGAIVASRAGIGLARDDGHSFAMVRVEEGMGGVTVERDNVAIGRTAESGVLVVPGMRPYEENRLRLRPEDVPMAGAITQQELVVVPGRRGVVVADFGVDVNTWISATLERSDGAGIPVGSTLYVAGEEAGLVGYDGVVYFETGQAGPVRLRAEWGGGSCTAQVEIPKDKGVHETGIIPCIVD